MTLFAFAAGVLAGALLRRTIPAMAATLTALIAVRIFAEEYARPRYQAPLTRITDPGMPSDPAPLPSTDWTIDSTWIDQTGHRLTDAEKANLIHQIYSGTSSQLVNRFMSEHGLRYHTAFQPNSRFWAFQTIETIGFGTLTAVLIAATFRVVRRRTT